MILGRIVIGIVTIVLTMAIFANHWLSGDQPNNIQILAVLICYIVYYGSKERE